MIRFSFCLLLCLVALLMIRDAPKAAAGASDSNTPQYTADGQLMFPANYREWIYLTTGMDMDYNPELANMDHSMFDNIFVNPEAYKAFVATGTWPDKTILVLEGRMAANKGSINQKGHFQTTDIMARSDPHKGRSALPRQMGLRGIWRQERGKNVSERGCLLLLSRTACGGRHHVCAVLSDACLRLRRRRVRCSPAYLKEEAASARNDVWRGHSCPRACSA